MNVACWMRQTRDLLKFTRGNVNSKKYDGIFSRAGISGTECTIIQTVDLHLAEPSPVPVPKGSHTVTVPDVSVLASSRSSLAPYLNVNDDYSLVLMLILVLPVCY